MSSETKLERIKRRIAAHRMILGMSALQARCRDRDGEYTISDLLNEIEETLSRTPTISGDDVEAVRDLTKADRLLVWGMDSAKTSLERKNAMDDALCCVRAAIAAMGKRTGDEVLEDALASRRCSIPPSGWWCSREAGHEGPCAARPVNPAQRLCDALRSRFDDEPDFLGIEAADWIEVAGEALQRVHRYALAAEGMGYDLILSATEPLIARESTALKTSGRVSENG